MLQIFFLSASILFWQHQPGISQETLESLFHSNLESCSQVMVFRRIARWMSGMLRLIGLLSWRRDQRWPLVLKEAGWEGGSDRLLVITLSILLCVLVSGIICLDWSCFTWFWSTMDPRKSIPECLTGFTHCQRADTQNHVCMFVSRVILRSSVDLYVRWWGNKYFIIKHSWTCRRFWLAHCVIHVENFIVTNSFNSWDTTDITYIDLECSLKQEAKIVQNTYAC